MSRTMQWEEKRSPARAATPTVKPRRRGELRSPASRDARLTQAEKHLLAELALTIRAENLRLMAADRGDAEAAASVADIMTPRMHALAGEFNRQVNALQQGFIEFMGDAP